MNDLKTIIGFLVCKPNQERHSAISKIDGKLSIIDKSDQNLAFNVNAYPHLPG